MWSISDKLPSNNHIWILLIHLLGIAAWNRGPWVLLLVCLMHFMLFLLHSCDLSPVITRWPHGVSSYFIDNGLLISSFPKKERKENGYSHGDYQHFFDELLGFLKYLILFRGKIERISISLLSLKRLICLFLIASLHFICKFDIKTFLIILLSWLLVCKD